MMSVQQFQTMVANSLFQGDMTLQGLVMFGAIVGMIFALTRNSFQTGLIMLLPAQVFCTMIGILNGDVAVLIVIMIVIQLALQLKIGLSTT